MEVDYESLDIDAFAKHLADGYRRYRDDEPDRKSWAKSSKMTKDHWRQIARLAIDFLEQQ